MRFIYPNEYNDLITLNYGDPLIDKANIYEIEHFEVSSDTVMPDNLDCPILKYDIVETSMGVYELPD